MTDDIAIAHKDYVVRGGGERLAEELSRTFDAPLFVGRRNAENEPDDLEASLEEIDWGPLPDRVARWAIGRGGAPRSVAYMLTWLQQEALTAYDTIITSGNEPLWYTQQDDQTVIAYTHSPPRWHYDLFHELDGGLLTLGFNLASRALYRHNADRPDLFVANSDLVARRIQQAWGIREDKIRVVYPPVRTHEYDPADADTEDFYFHLGRLDGPKRIDELVETFNQLGADYPLKIAGKGPERERLEALADDHIELLGFVSEERKHELMAAAKAHVYPAQNEDFGMVPVESMAAGTPVIGVNEGFTQYQIMDGKNGDTYTRGSATDGLADAIQRFETEGVEWSAEEIAAFAERFGVDQFREGMREAVQAAQRRSAVTTPWGDETPSTETPQPVRADGGDE